MLNPKQKRLKFLGSKSSKDGRVLSAVVSGESVDFQVMCVYAPTAPGERESFFDSLGKWVIKSFDKLILAGDFNCVEDPQIDRHPPRTDKSYTRGMENLKSFLNRMTWKINGEGRIADQKSFRGFRVKLGIIRGAELTDFTLTVGSF